MEDFSLSNSLSKGSVYESDSIYKAYQDDAMSRLADGVRPEAISNEAIHKGDVILETYTVEGNAIHGGMGSVWRVHHQSWNAELAMKRPQPRFFAEGSARRKEDFIAECEHWINLGLHPNIVSCYYVRDIGGVPTIFSEWIDGGSLKDAIESGRLYEGMDDEVQTRILDIAIQSARGLQYAHEQGLIHQDVKPGNILLTMGWDAKVADFGLAKAQSQLNDGDKPASSGYTPAYCPKAQAEGAPAEKWMDVYAWALTAIEMYAGKRPWESGAEAAQRVETYLGSARIPVPKAVAALLKDCLTNAADGFPQVIKGLVGIYSQTVGKAYPRPEVQAAADTAETLNNRALSFIDLGKSDLAEALWQEALRRTPNDLASIYNQGLFLWRRGEIDDEEVMRRCAASNMARGKEGLAGRWRDQINGERGVSEATLFEQSDQCQVIGGFKYATRVALTADGKRLYAVSNTLRCYDTTTMQCLFETPADHISAHAILLTRDERRVLLGGADKRLKAVDALTGELLYASEACDGVIEHLCLHPNGRVCYSLSDYGESALCKWDVATGKRLSYIRGQSRSYSDLRISPDGRYLYYCDGKLIRKEDPGLERDTWVHARSVSVTEAGDRLYAVGEFATRIVDAGTLKVVKEFPCVGYQSRLAGHDARLFTADKSLKIWDTRTLRCERTLFGHRTTITGISVSDDMSLIATGSKDDHEVRLWRNPGPEAIVPAPWELSVARGYREVSDTQNKIRAFSEQIERAIGVSDDERALSILERAEHELDAEGAEPLRMLRRRLTRRCERVRLAEVYEIGAVDSVEEKYSLRQVDVNAATGELAVTTSSGCACLWNADLTARTDLQTPDRAFCICFSASGEFLAVGMRGQIMVWRRQADGYEEYRHIRRIDPDEEHAVEHILFSPDGRSLLAANSQICFTLIDMASGKARCIRRLDDDMPGVQAMAFSPDGKRVVTLDIHGQFVVQDARDGATVFEQKIKGIASRVFFSGDGARLYFSAYGKRMEPKEEGQLICAMDTANWRVVERKRYLQEEVRLSLEKVAVSPDGRFLATGKDSVLIWSFPDMTLLFELQVPERSKLGRITRAVFSGDMTRLYVLSYNRILSWELKWTLRPRGHSQELAPEAKDSPAAEAEEPSVTEAEGSSASGSHFTEASDVIETSIRAGDVVDGRYEVLSDAIVGGMNRVWHVRRRDTGKEWAMEQPALLSREDGWKRFRETCLLWRGLEAHPGVVACHALEEIDGVPTAFCDWMDGGTVRQRMLDGSLYAGGDAAIQRRIVRIALQTARGLRHVHAQGIVHGDVKPANILLTAGEDARIGDFGLARRIADVNDGDPASRALGFTRAYCPDEQAGGEPLKPWMDVYAWALTVLEMFIGKRPWETGARVADRFMEYAHGGKAMPEGMIALLRCCVEKEMRGFDEVIAKLEPIAGALPEADAWTGKPAEALTVAESVVSAADMRQLERLKAECEGADARVREVEQAFARADARWNSPERSQMAFDIDYKRAQLKGLGLFGFGRKKRITEELVLLERKSADWFADRREAKEALEAAQKRSEAAHRAYDDLRKRLAVEEDA